MSQNSRFATFATRLKICLLLITITSHSITHSLITALPPLSIYHEVPLRVDGWGGGWNLYRLISTPYRPAAGVGAKSPTSPQLTALLSQLLLGRNFDGSLPEMSGQCATPPKLLPTTTDTPQLTSPAEFPGGNDSSGVASMAPIPYPSLSSRIGRELAELASAAGHFFTGTFSPEGAAGQAAGPNQARLPDYASHFFAEKVAGHKG